MNSDEANLKSQGARELVTSRARHYNAEHKDARQYNANHLNLLVTPGAASFEPLKLRVGHDDCKYS